MRAREMNRWAWLLVGTAVALLASLCASQDPTHSQQALRLVPGARTTAADMESVKTRLDALPDHLFVTTKDDLVLQYYLSGTTCGRVSNTSFCLQSLATSSWIGRVVTHFPVGAGDLVVSDVSEESFKLSAEYRLDRGQLNRSTGAASMFAQFLPPSQSSIVSRAELEFRCNRSTMPPFFPQVSLGVDLVMENGLLVHRYRMLAEHMCACAGIVNQQLSQQWFQVQFPRESSTSSPGASLASSSEELLPQHSCYYFNQSYLYASAMQEWESKSPDHSGEARVCFTQFSDRLYIWASVGLLFIAILWIADIWLGMPLLALDSCGAPRDEHGHRRLQEGYATIQDERSTFRGRCLASSATRHRLHPLGSMRYIWTFGFLDVLTPPVNMLERRDSAWATAAAFGMMSLTIPFIFNGALQITQILEVLLFFTPLLLCRHARFPSLGLIFGLIFCIIALAEIGNVMGCLAKYASLVNFMAVLPSLLCSMLLMAWYSLETKRRFIALYKYFRGTGPRPFSWRERALIALDRSCYVAGLLANKIKVNMGESLTWSAFKATMLGQERYSVPTRLLSAVILSICCLVSLLPLTMSYAGLAGAAVEWAMSFGHCCSGVQCDPTPGAYLWIPDPFDLGYGIQLGHGEACSRDQIVIRRAVSYGMTVSTSIIAVAVTFSLLHVLVVYRKRMFLLFRGRPDFITKPVPMDKSIGSTLKFGGTQVASAIGGWVLGTCVLTLLIAFIAISTVLPFMNIYGDWFWPWWFQFVIYDHETGAFGFPVILLINYWLLLFCVRFVFQISKQDHGLQKRGFFHLMDLIQFIFYILNALLGLIKRAVTSMVLQAIFVSRMDKSLMPRKYELLDKSYVAYLGFMQLDFYYSHPVLLTAVYFFLAGTPRDRRMNKRVGLRLWRSRNKSTSSDECSNGMQMSMLEHAPVESLPNDAAAAFDLSRSICQVINTVPEAAVLERSASDSSREYSHRVRNMFWLAITLHNNPSVREFRLHYLQTQEEERKKLNAEEAAKRVRHRRFTLGTMAQMASAQVAQVTTTLTRLRYHPMTSVDPTHSVHLESLSSEERDSLVDAEGDGLHRRGTIYTPPQHLEDEEGHYEELPHFRDHIRVVEQAEAVSSRTVSRRHHKEYTDDGDDDAGKNLGDHGVQAFESESEPERIYDLGDGNDARSEYATVPAHRPAAVRAISVASAPRSSHVISFYDTQEEEEDATDRASQI
eukprot:m.143945 g.143945  ORF g.143945 m.143945 type:complete len:1214 (+) comp16032_c0_seq1:141-3782(+)